MAYTYKKDKNYYLFYKDENPKPYKFDINTCTFYGLAGKPIKTYPSGLNTFLSQVGKKNSNVLALLYQCMSAGCAIEDFGFTSLSPKELNHFQTSFTLLDKLDSLNIPWNQLSTYRLLSENNSIIFNKYFKQIIAEFQNNPENFSLSDQLAHYILIESGIYNIPPEFKDMAYRLYSENNLTSSQISMAIYYITKELKEFFQLYGGSNLYEAKRYILNFFMMCKYTGIEPKKESFFKQYLAVQKTYFAKKEAYDIEALNEQYKKHKWHFEDENFFVIVPTCPKDFEDEANNQHNCVFTSYLPRVIKHETNVVFIRKKDNPNSNYITCEITNNGMIRQFLLKYNHMVEKDSIEQNFAKKYGQWLQKTWGEVE